MSRGLTAGMLSAIAAEEVRPAFLAEFAFDSGTLRFWSGAGILEYDGVEWTGAGLLGGLSEIGESGQLRAEGMRFSLSGIPSDMIALPLTQDYRGRPARLWLALLDAAGAVIPDPVALQAGTMDVMDIIESGETSTIELSVENRLLDFQRAREWRYTDAHQKRLHPGDRGLEFVAALATKDIVWKFT